RLLDLLPRHRRQRVRLWDVLAVAPVLQLTADGEREVAVEAVETVDPRIAVTGGARCAVALERLGPLRERPGGVLPALELVPRVGAEAGLEVALRGHVAQTARLPREQGAAPQLELGGRLRGWCAMIECLDGLRRHGACVALHDAELHALGQAAGDDAA